MSRPIESTPVLLGRSAARFDRLMKSCKYHPLPKRRINWKKIDAILQQESQNASKDSSKKEPGEA
ncbi:MAG: hypothetical protein IKR81_17270 [Victivallales bacterium]|nr:hypothetical protein [Victivallales bacterium]